MIEYDLRIILNTHLFYGTSAPPPVIRGKCLENPYTRGKAFKFLFIFP